MIPRCFRKVFRQRRLTRPRIGRCRSRRAGATAIEAVFTLPIYLMIVLGTLDLGTAVFRQHQVTNAANLLSRRAATHGSRAAALGVWGPAPLTGNAADGSVVGQFLAQRVPGPAPGSITYEIEWPDGGNDSRSGHRTRVTVTASHSLIFTSLFGLEPMAIRSSITAPITH